MSETPPAVTTPTPKDLLARALVELRALRQRLAEAERAASQPIAVIGLGCRFPGGCDSPAALWRFLSAGGDATGEPPPGRFAGEPPPDVYTRRGAYLARVDGFDDRFFGVTERELRSLDPQHRLLLEVCWEALEHAAIAPDRLRRSRTGVFCGISTSDYADLLAERVPLADVDGYFGPGTALSFGPGRVAYFLGLQGPSLAVDTACSSSLVAVHLACQSLQRGESDLALAAGVNLVLSPAGHVVLCRARVLSPEGRCKTFDAGADGYARGEGCGVIVLRRLADALAAGDPILAVVRGTAVNQDGPASGLTVPNPAAQEAVIREALARARLDPAAVDYVEAHGTGTALGDPIEVRALAAALGPGRPADRPLLLGTIKTNIGHLESAAGIAGIIKTILAVQHGELPRHLHLRRPSPAVAWHSLPVEVVQTHRSWPPGPRIAGVSSFGASGTNAHAIVGALTPELIAAATHASAAATPTSKTPSPSPTDAAPATHTSETSTASASSTRASPATHTSAPPSTAPRAELLLLSAAGEPALRALAGRHAALLGERQDLALADVCATAALARARHAHALALVGDDRGALARDLAAFAAGEPAPPRLRRGHRPARPPALAFVFSGQGAQLPGGTAALRAELPAFRAALADCDDLLRPHLGRSVVDLLDDPHPPADTASAQPALFALGWALAAQWRAFGVEPAALLGHSLGEYLAACLAGVLRLEHAAPLVARRAALMQALPRGVMVAVSLGEADVAAAIAGRPGPLAIAAINSPAETVLSGSQDALAPVLAELAARGAHARPLRVSHAFHSPLMDPALAAFEREVAAVPLAPPTRPLISCLSGRLAGDEVTRPDYWRRHLREPVRFAAGLAALRDLHVALALEIGPGAALSALAVRAEPLLTAVPTLRGGSGRAAVLDAVGELAVRGVDIAWPVVHAGADARRPELPTYPFQRRRHWLPDAPAPSASPPSPALGAHDDPASDPLLGRRLPDRDGAAIFSAELRADGLPIYRDHRVYGRVVVSGAVHAAMVLRAARIVQPAHPRVDLEELEFLAPLVLPDDGSVAVETRVLGDRFELVRAGAAPLVLSRGRLAPSSRPAPPAHDLAAVRARCPEELDGDEFYARHWRPDEHDLGPSFRTIRTIWRRDGEALARLRPPAIDLDDPRGPGREALLAACIGEVYGQVLMPAVPDFAAVVAGLEHTFLGSGMAHSRDHGGPARAAYVRAVVHRYDGDELRGDVALLDEHGAVLVEIVDLRARRVPRAALQQAVTRGAPGLASPPLAGPAHTLADRVRSHVRARVAALVGDADLDDTTTLQALGLDSLMVVDLHDGLRRELGVTVPLATTLQGDTLEQLTHNLVTALRAAQPAASPPATIVTTAAPASDPPARRAPRPWLRPLRPAPRATTRVLAFPHGGAGPAAFLPWRPHLPDDLDVQVAQLPGRWERLHDPVYTRMDPLIADLLADVVPQVEPPFVLLGVSFGALVAYELARALVRAGGPAPAHLFVLAYPAPDLPNPLERRRPLVRELRSDDPARVAAAAARLGMIPEALLDRDSLHLLLPALRADLELVLDHPHRPGPPLPLPISALGGSDDPDIARDPIAAWSRHTDRDFTARILAGPHLFYRTDPRATLAAIQHALAAPTRP